MKALILAIIILSLAVCANSATLKFDPSNGADGYIVYYTDGVNSWSNDIGNNTSVDLSEFNLTPGEYIFHVKAYNKIGLSDPSNNAEYSLSEFVITENPKPITIVIPGPVTITINQG